jgi:glucose/arabinose dehydrogenase
MSKSASPWSRAARAAALLAASTLAARAEITNAPPPPKSHEVKAEIFAKGLEHPWGMQFLPDGRILVSERPGRLRIVARDGRPSPPIAGVPDVVARNQGGLLDVALDPAYRQNQLIYFSYAEPRSGGTNGTSVARARLVTAGPGGRLEGLQVIFRQKPDYASALHFGSRLAFARDGLLFVTLGDRYTGMKEAQNPSNHFGKIVRITPDGSAPRDNPRKVDWAPEIWSIGHRNVQAGAIHPETGRLWTVEHGARGGDEINVPQPGRNYGWPVITYGRDYSGAKIGEGTSKPGLEQPIYYWDPSIAPSGMAFYTGDLFPNWKGNLFVGALAGQHLSRLVIEGEKVTSEEKLLTSLGERIRDVRQGPDGALWLLTDSPDGRVLRVVPVR